MGLKRLRPERRRRRSRLRRERSAISAWTSCSRIWWGDQWALLARARKSSSCVGTARSPICWSCAGKLFLGIVVVLIAGEFIVNLQVMRPNFDRLSLRMVAEIEGQARRARLTAQQECDSGGVGSIALQRFHNGA